MKSGGRILVAGSISTYNATDEKKCNLYTVLIKFSNAIEFWLNRALKDPTTNLSILMKSLTVKGFIASSFIDQWPRAFTEMNKLIQEVFFFISAY